MLKEPTALVEAFIADFLLWNTAAQARHEHTRHSGADLFAAVELAKQEYAGLLIRYCRPGFTGQPISYGLPGLHDPLCEEVVSVKTRGDRCLVTTRMSMKLGKGESVQNFEYRLSWEGNRWFLESIRYVANDGRYETL